MEKRETFQEMMEGGKFLINVSVNNDKYRVRMAEGGGLHALRYGKEWRDCVGDNLIYWLAVELQEARNTIEKLEEKNQQILDILEND